MSTNEVLRLDRVSKAFGGVIPADQVSFEVHRGEIVGLIGPNGAGKTTTLNLISGINAIDTGQVFLEGADVTAIPAHKRAKMGIGRTFQSPRFLQRSSIRDNMLLGTDLAAQKSYLGSFFSRADRTFDAEIGKLMKIAGFALDWDEPITSLPYGRQKILEIVRTLLAHPKVMLVDEPAAGLNSKELEHVVSLLRYATQQYSMGVLLIEHSMDLIMSICDNIVVLNFGKRIAYGSPAEVSRNNDVIEAYLGRDYSAEN